MGFVKLSNEANPFSYAKLTCFFLISIFVPLQVGRCVPVILPQDVSAVLTYIASGEVRKACLISADNPYLFANRSKFMKSIDHYLLIFI